MIGTAKVKPSFYRCRECLYEQLDYNVILDCNKCSIKNRPCAILKIEKTIWKTYALVLYEDDGSLEEVSLDRLCDVKLKEVKE